MILHEKWLKTNRIIKGSKQSPTVSAPTWTHCLTDNDVTWYCYFCPINLQLFSHWTCRNTTSQNQNFSKKPQNTTILQFNTAMNKEALFKSVSLLSDPGQGTKRGQTSHYPPADITLATISFSSKTPLSVLSPKKGPEKRLWLWSERTSLLSPLDSVKSPPSGHSLNTYNICLCGTTECIQWINNKTMATFHSATRLSAQWNALLWLSKHSPCTEWTSH